MTTPIWLHTLDMTLQQVPYRCAPGGRSMSIWHLHTLCVPYQERWEIPDHAHQVWSTCVVLQCEVFLALRVNT